MRTYEIKRVNNYFTEDIANKVPRSHTGKQQNGF
jgi:hypothetical protein